MKQQEPKYDVGDSVELLDFSKETSDNCPSNHFWIDKMDDMVSNIFIIKGCHQDGNDIYYTLNNPGTSWGFCEHWLRLRLKMSWAEDLLPEGLFEI